MLLFFHDIGMPPLWVLTLWLASFLSFPVFFIKGLHSLLRRKSDKTLVITILVFFLVALIYNFLWVFINAEIGFFVFITIPFGIGSLPLLAMSGLSNFFVVLFGIIVNFVSIYGAVDLTEKIIAEKR